MNVCTQTHLRAHCSNWLKLTYGFRFSVFFDCYFLPQVVPLSFSDTGKLIKGLFLVCSAQFLLS